MLALPPQFLPCAGCCEPTTLPKVTTNGTYLPTKAKVGAHDYAYLAHQYCQSLSNDIHHHPGPCRITLFAQPHKLLACLLSGITTSHGFTVQTENREPCWPKQVLGAIVSDGHCHDTSSIGLGWMGTSLSCESQLAPPLSRLFLGQPIQDYELHELSGHKLAYSFHFHLCSHIRQRPVP
ncbi:hypothetical protein BGZ63DRAFT_10566 [Mariannaea sp. PMI_226]|nr:hypothetical protein BGZ63DRAFT_10566 [Mariannaea sp. PMI_226]